MEATTPTPPAAADGAPRKRPLELGRPAFTATEDGGAYHVLEMPKRHRCGLTTKPRTRRLHFLMSSSDDGAAGREEDEDEKKKRRVLELDKPEFVAEEDGDGAYDIREMSKKYKFESMADPESSSCPLALTLNTDHARTLASLFRVLSVSNRYLRERKAMAAARLNSQLIMHMDQQRDVQQLLL